MNVTLKDGRVLLLPDAHIALQGTPNSGKTEFCASAETPMIVMAIDPITKLHPYFNRGILDPEEYVGAQGQPVRIVRSRKTGNAIIQIESYYDEDEQNPVAMTQLLARLPQITDEVKAKKWRTLVIDSWSQLEWIARFRRMYGTMQAKSPYWEAQSDLQTMVNARLMNLKCNLIVTFHIATKITKNRAGEVIKGPKNDIGGGEDSYTIQAIGDLKNLPGVFGENYLSVAPTDGSDNYYLQTRRDANFRTLCSRIGAPNPCPNTWNAIFGPWIEREAALSPLPNPAADDAASTVAAATPTEEK